MTRSSIGILARLGALVQRSATAVAESSVGTSPSCSSRPLSTVAGLVLRRWGLQLGPQGTLGACCSPQAALCLRGFAKKPPTPPPPPPPNYFVHLGNLRDNPGATRPRIRVGRGNGGRRGNYCGRGMKGQNSRGRGLHMLYDGGELGLLKFPVVRQRPSYEVLYYHLGLSRVLEHIQLGLLDPSRTITMKDLYDTGCVTRNIKYGVLLYGKAQLPIPLDIQVTACDPDTRACVEAAGGRVVRVYYTLQGLGAILHPEKFTSRRLPLPLPAARWHPRYDSKFDAIGQIPPAVRANPLPAYLSVSSAESAAVKAGATA